MTGFEMDDTLARIALGDARALETLYRELWRPVYYFALYLCKNEAMAEDVAQDAFVAVIRSAASYRSRGRGRSWVMTIVRNTALNVLGRRTALPLDEAEEPVDSARFEDSLDDEADVLEALAVLGSKERDIVTLRVLAGFTLTEAARLLGLPKGSVFWSYASAMKKLKTYYGAHESPEASILKDEERRNPIDEQRSTRPAD